MAEGLTLSNVVDSKFRRYHKFPNWDPVQPRSEGQGQSHHGDYHLSLNDSGNVLYITAKDDSDINKGQNLNEGQGQIRNVFQYQRNTGHVSPRKWHHGDVRRDLMTDNTVRQSNQALDDHGNNGLDKNVGIEMGPVKNQGQITIHYNGLDLNDAFAADENNKENVEKVKIAKKHRQNTSGKSHSMDNKISNNYYHMKKEYIDRSRAKEREYNLYNNREDHLKNPSTIIRYDIEAPIGGRIQYVDIPSPTNKHESRVTQSQQGKPSLIEAEVTDAPKTDFEDSHQFCFSPSVSLSKFGARGTHNTRFGSQGKVTAYRPSTSLDNHRKKKLENIMEAPVNDIDTEEGRKIWEEVNTIMKEPLVPPSLPQRKMGYKIRDIHTSNNSVEFWPSFEKEPAEYKLLENNLWREGKENQAHINSDSIRHYAFRNVLDPSKSPEAINLGDYGRQGRPRMRSLNEAEIRFNRMDPDEFRIPQNQIVRRHASAPMLQVTDYNGNITVLPDVGQKQPVYHSVDNSRLITDARDNARFLTDSTNDRRAMTDGRNGNIRLVYPSGDVINEHYVHVPQDGACKGNRPRMTTTLPRITPANTPLPPGVCQAAPPRAHSSASMYGAYPPKDLSGSMDFIKMPGRVNPLAPPPPRKRINWSWETTNQHWENDKRRILMQKREHTRYHSAWSKAFYGAPAEKEAYRRHFRDVLKQQMSDRENSRREEITNKVKETERAVKYDEKCRSNDAQEYFRKHSYLMQYRDGNKQQMEDKWAESRQNKFVEDRVDRERLRYNPINWSCSLK